MLIAALSDLHGIRSRFEKARRLFDQGIKVLLLGGDIAQNGPPDYQKANVKACFDVLLSGKKDVQVFAIAGNDDWQIVEETLHEFAEVTDPAKLERALITHRLNLEGYRTRGLERYEFRFDPGDRKNNISADLRKLAGFSDPQKTVYLFHCPPYGFFDFGIGIAAGVEGCVHIGSRSIAEFIRRSNPWLTIHGHSHEAVSVMKGVFTFRIGKSIGAAVGAGNDPSILNGLVIDVASRSLRRITL